MATLFFASQGKVESQINPECEAIGITETLNFVTEIIPSNVFPGDAFCVQFKAENFTSIVSFQFTLNIDPTELCFDSFFAEPGILTGPLGVNEMQANAGIITFLWFNQNAQGQSIPDESLLFTVCFDACGEPTDCLEIGFNNVLEDFPNTEINYQTPTGESCTSDILLIDGEESTCVPVECVDLTIVDLGICNAGQGNMGAIDFSICGGTAPYDYAVTAGAITVKSGTITDPFGTFSGTLDGLPPMVYTLTVSDAAGNNVSMPVIIDNTEPVTFDPLIIVNPNCAESTNGEITINNISSGIPGELFDIAFSNGLTFQDVTEATADRLTNGDYFITITDNQGCQTIEMATVFTPPLELDIQTMPATCQGANDGFLSVDIVGGTPFSDGTYLINGNRVSSLQTTTPFLDPDFSNISGLYRIRVRDSLGCILNEDVEVPVLTEIELEILNLEDNVCRNSCEGSFSMVVTEPDGSYTFLVRDEDNNFVSNLAVIGDTLFADQVLCAGTYSIVVEDFMTGCRKDTFFTINEPAEELTLEFEDPTVSCGGNDGVITVNLTGGMSPYDYMWEDDLTNNSNTLSNVGNGTYNLTVSDDLGCVIDTFITIMSDNTLEIEAFIATNLACDGTGTGILDVNIINSTSQNFTYQWTDINGSPIGNNQMQPFVNPGDYIVIVTTPDNGCESIDTVNVPTEFGLTFEIELTHPTCEQARNGSIEVINIQGGEGPYTCIWEDTTISSCNPDGLSENTYNFMVIDANGCQKDTFATLIAEEIDITFDINPRGVSCPGNSDGSVNIMNFNGGQGPYQCSWEDPIHRLV